MALEDTPTGVASLRDALHSLSQEDVTFLSSGTRQNLGLALAANAELRDEMPVMTAAAGLLLSPMFWLAVVDYAVERRESAIRANSEEVAEEESFPLRLLCARMFLAGVLAGNSSKEVL